MGVDVLHLYLTFRSPSLAAGTQQDIAFRPENGGETGHLAQETGINRRHCLKVSYGITGLAYGTTNFSIAELTYDLSGGAFSLDGPVGLPSCHQVIKRTASEQQSRPRVRCDSFGIFKPGVSIGVHVGKRTCRSAGPGEPLASNPQKPLRLDDLPKAAQSSCLNLLPVHFVWTKRHLGGANSHLVAQFRLRF